MSEIHDWLFHFILGIVYAANVNHITSFLNRYNKYVILILLILFFGILAFCRTYNVIPHFSGSRLDGFLSVNIVVLSLWIVRQYNTIQYNTIQYNTIFRKTFYEYFHDSYIYFLLFFRKIHLFFPLSDTYFHCFIAEFFACECLVGTVEKSDRHTFHHEKSEP
jgi:hypothetical protein